MSAKPRHVLSILVGVAVASIGPASAGADRETTGAASTSALAGPWTISFGTGGAACRILLRNQRADAGDYFLGMPAACRHAMPGLETIGRWARPDAGHLSLDDPAGKAVLVFAVAPGGGFSATAPEGAYVLKPAGNRSEADAGLDAIDAPAATGFATVQTVATRHVREKEVDETPSALAGRYAVMREKRDTGCMVTLDDQSRVKGGERAQLAPGCRDQGIVIFDPSAWQLVKGKLVLTARAGHKAVLDKTQDGLWEKDVKDGGKPLGLKKL